MANSNRRTAVLRWTGTGLVFDGEGGGGGSVRMDGDSKDGSSPMELLLLALAGCMAIDVRSTLEKSRVELKSMEVRIEGVRADEHPRRYTSVDMVFELEGPGSADRHRIERAIQLSAEKYCSVHHTLRPDLAVNTSYELV